MTKKELAKLRKNLPTRYLDELAKRTGMSTSTCSKVLNGHFNSDVVLQAALDLAHETKEKNSSFRKGIKKL